MRALIIADSPSSAVQIASRVSTEIGYLVHIASADVLAEVHNLMSQEPCDVMLLNLGGSDLDGQRSLELVRTLAPAVPIIVFRNIPELRFEIEAIQSGAQDILSMSALETEDLTRAIQFSIDRHKIVRENAGLAQRLESARLTAVISETHFRTVFECARDGIVVIDEDGRYRDANPAIVEILGYSWDEICSRRVGDFSAECPEQSHQDFRSLIDSVSGPLRIRRQRRLRRKDGRVIIVEQHATRVMLPIGLCILSIWRDVTEQRQASDALLQWSEYFQRSEQGLFAAPSDPLLPGICNPAYARMHGLTVDEVAALPRFALVPERELPQVQKNLVDLDDVGHLVFETIHLRKDGSEFPVLVDATTVRGASGAVSYRLIHLTDITERKRVEVERTRLLTTALAAETRYRGLFAFAEAAIIVLNDQRVIVEVNPAALSMLNYDTEAGLLGMEIGNLVNESMEPLQTAFVTLATQGRWRGDLEWKRRDGSVVPVDMSASLVELPDRKLVLVSAHDISDRLALEQLRREFLGVVAHELRTPLTAIGGWAQMILRGSDPNRAAEVIADQTRQLDRLIDDLLDVSQIDAGKLKLRTDAIDLATLTRETIEREATAYPDRHISFTCNRESVPHVVDAQRIVQVVRNLVSNAVKYSPDGGEILVHLEDQGDYVVISVQDQGLGIAAESLPSIFERFARLESGREVARGSGLGLPISRALVEAHGGRLWAESEGAGKGSVFRVSLPRNR
ncbi:MAG: PAS domain S-box protein [Chloroflexota bacterium]